VTYELAGLASRIGGAALDTLLQSMGVMAAWLIVLIVAGGLAAMGVGEPGLGGAMGSWIVAIGWLLTFLIFFGYFLFFEARWNGQTPGKRAAGIRVMKDGGFPIDFRAAVVRNLVRIFDALLPPYAIGITVAFFSREYKRLGDFAAGTVVIRERPRTAPGLEIKGYEAPPNLPRLEELHAIRHFLDRRAQLPAETRANYARRLALAFGRLLGYPLDQVAAGPEAFLQWLVEESARRHGA
jgi:uncharacterized RDD family membrane protein YckC